MRITDVELACDTIEAGYRVVELEDGRHAFVWGNIWARRGDTLPRDALADPTCERGIEVYPTYEEAVAAYRRCAEALGQTDERAASDMLAILPD